MGSLGEKIDLELRDIEGLLAELPMDRPCASLSPLELAGAAALLQRFYSGVENVLWQITRERGLTLPEGPSWHRDLVAQCVREGVLCTETAEELGRYLAFRHFFTHSYAVRLRPEPLEPLVRDAGDVYSRFCQDLRRALGQTGP